MSRAVAFLEAHVGVHLLHRTTRSLRLSEAGERYAAACRRVLADLKEADLLAAGERAAPRGLITVTAPLVAGAWVLRPILDACGFAHWHIEEAQTGRAHAAWLYVIATLP